MNRRKFIRYLGLAMGGMLASLVRLFVKPQVRDPLGDVHSWPADKFPLGRFPERNGEGVIVVSKHMKEEATLLVKERMVRSPVRHWVTLKDGDL